MIVLLLIVGCCLLLHAIRLDGMRVRVNHTLNLPHNAPLRETLAEIRRLKNNEEPHDAMPARHP